MKDYIYKYIYPRDLRLVIVISVVMAVLWVIFDHKIKRKYWKIINFVLLTISVLVILELTVFSRAHGQSTFYPIPFYSFRAAKQFPEFYRLNIMNGFLFVPFGLSLPVVIPDKVKYKAGAAVICGLLFSAACSFFISTFFCYGIYVSIIAQSARNVKHICAISGSKICLRGAYSSPKNRRVFSSTCFVSSDSSTCMCFASSAAT